MAHLMLTGLGLFLPFFGLAIALRNRDPLPALPLARRARAAAASMRYLSIQIAPVRHP